MAQELTVGVLHGLLYFGAFGEAGDPELWTSDGTPQGAREVASIGTTPPSSPSVAPFPLNHFTALGDAIYVFGYDPDLGCQVWRSDGTAEGTSRVTSVQFSYHGFPSFPGQIVASGSQLYFALTGPDDGDRLWVTDGGPGDERLVFDPATIDSSAESGLDVLTGLSAIGSEVCFETHLRSARTVPYFSDGTNEGTVPIPTRGGDPISKNYVTTFDGRAFFEVGDQNGAARRWATDGTEAGAAYLTGTPSGPAWSLGAAPAEVVGGDLYLNLTADDGNEVYRVGPGSTTADFVGQTADDLWAVPLLELPGGNLEVLGDDGRHGVQPLALSPGPPDPTFGPLRNATVAPGGILVLGLSDSTYYRSAARSSWTWRPTAGRPSALPSNPSLGSNCRPGRSPRSRPSPIPRSIRPRPSCTAFNGAPRRSTPRSTRPPA